MFGEEGSSFISSEKDDTSDEFNSMVDKKVKEILEKSSERVTQLIKEKDHQLRELSKNLFWYDYVSADEIDTIMKGKKLNKEKVREWKDKNGIIF